MVPDFDFWPDGVLERVCTNFGYPQNIKPENYNYIFCIVSNVSPPLSSFAYCMDTVWYILSPMPMYSDTPTENCKLCTLLAGSYI